MPASMHTPMHTAAARAHPVAAQLHAVPKAGPVASKILPTLAVAGATYAVASYVKSQLKREAGDLDRIYAKQNTPEVEAARKADLCVDSYGDPRNNLLNFLGWSS
ncbi:hypothetical protein F4809DRAFT_587286 [Biscogniauxia mediterranea]|nr:hypothetical protein F4809DRAFT_587286 [Biscogniauxia mediterranea]